MTKSLRVCALLLAAACGLQAQILINEVHGFGGGSSPVLPGDYLEIWNQGPTNYDLTGHSIGIWAGDTGVVTTVTIPCDPSGRSIIPANGFWILQEGLAQLGQPLTGTLASLQGMRGLPATWASTSNMGARLLDPAGNCIDYVYLRRGTTAVPASAPNLVAPCTWTLGNVGTLTTGRAHIHRLTNTNTSSFADWADNPTATVGTPGAPNTIATATQTSTGPVGSINPTPAWESNSPAASLDINGSASTPTGPAVATVCVGAVAAANLASTNVGLPWDLAVTLGDGLAAPSLCGPGNGGLGTAGNQAVNVNLADPTLLFLNGLTFAVPFAPFSIPLPTVAPLPILGAQMIVIDPSNIDGFALSAFNEFSVRNFETRTLALTDDSTTNVVLTGLCGGLPLNVFGTAFTNMWVNSNGRVMFGAAGDTDLSPTVGEALLDNPAVGFWTDLNPAAAGSAPVTVSTANGLVTVAWNGTYYFGTTTAVNFNVSFDPASDAITINYPNVPANPAGLGGGDGQWLGLSGGAAFTATDGGQTQFTTGVSVLGTNPTDMLYDFWTGLVAAAPGGVDRLASFGSSTGVLFSPIGGGVYQAFGL